MSLSSIVPILIQKSLLADLKGALPLPNLAQTLHLIEGVFWYFWTDLLTKHLIDLGSLLIILNSKEAEA